MRGLINDGLRWLIGTGVRAVGLPLEVYHWTRIRKARRRDRRMRRRYRLTATLPVRRWSPEVVRSLQQQATSNERVRMAMTSGTSTSPKHIPYTDRRLRSVKFAWVDMFIRACRAHHIRRTSLYVFGSLRADDSVTSLLLDEQRLPSYFSTLQAPYRVQRDPSMLALASVYGSTALRLWVLTMANPGVIYSTNPSTISVFLDELASDWRRHVRLVRDFRERPESFDRAVGAIARRLASRGSIDRLDQVAASQSALSLGAFAPSVEACICWTGGQVKPFLEKLTAHLPPERYRLIPMFSMSTETIETVPHFGGPDVAFLPMASGVCYEFIEESLEDQPENLRTADHLEGGKTYAMVVSDRYGLRRYMTGDLFLCRGFVQNLPDLQFLRRRELAYSFTGEKLTAEQLAVVFERLRDECPSLRPDDFLTCVPSQPPGEQVPHYKILLALGAEDRSTVAGEEIARRCDRLLGEVNCEYKHKRDSGRLGPVRAVRLPLADIVARLGGTRPQANWENQFKFLPLFPTTWESSGPSRT